MKPKLIICYGIPASGKTTWAKNQVLISNGEYVRVNRDDLRALINCSIWSKERERLIKQVRDSIITIYLKAGKHVIVDDTNIEGDNMEHLTNLGHELQAVVEIKDFPIDLDEAIKRDSKRQIPVGGVVIRRMYKAKHPEKMNYV